MNVLFDLSTGFPGMLRYSDRRVSLDENLDIEDRKGIIESSVGHEIRCAYENKDLMKWLTLGIGSSVYDTKFRTQVEVDLTKTPMKQEILIFKHGGGGLLTIKEIVLDEALRKEYQEEAVYALHQSFLAHLAVLVKDFLLVFPLGI